jgi:hypothetical protein
MNGLTGKPLIGGFDDHHDLDTINIGSEFQLSAVGAEGSKRLKVVHTSGTEHDITEAAAATDLQPLLPGAAAKVDLGTSDPSYSGTVVKYIVKSGVTVLRGQPLYAELTVGGVTYAKTLTSQMTDPGQPSRYIGVALRTVVGDGTAEVPVLVDGYTTLRTVSTFASNTYPDRPFRYTDDGDTTGNYSAYYSNVINNFDAGVGGTWEMVIHGLNVVTYFEATSYTIYDYLQLKVSNDGVNYSPASIGYLMDQVADKQSQTTPGSYFPQTEADLQGTGYTIGQTVITINARYLQFIFNSDVNTSHYGWNVVLTSSNASPGTPSTTADIRMDKNTNSGVTFVSSSGAANPFNLGAGLYTVLSPNFDTVDTFVTGDEYLVGTVAAEDGDNDSVFAWVRTSWRSPGGL